MAAGTTHAGTTPLAAEDAAQLLDAARFQLLSYLRTYRFLAMLVLTVLVTVVIGGVALYLTNAPNGDAFQGNVDLFLGFAFSFVALLIVLTASFLGGDAVATDFGSSAGYFTLVLPI